MESMYMPEEKTTVNPAIILSIQSIAFIVIGFGLNVFSSDAIKNSIPIFGIDLNNVLFLIVCGLAGFVLMAFSNIGLSYVFMNVSRNYRIASIASSKIIEESLDMGKSKIPVLILAALSEEVLFRFGAIPFIASFIITLPTQNAEAIIAATIISSFLFASVHFQYGNGYQFAQVLLAGLVLSGVYLISGNILLAGIVHAIVNLLALKMEPKMLDRFKEKFPQDFEEIA